MLGVLEGKKTGGAVATLGVMNKGEVGMGYCRRAERLGVEPESLTGTMLSEIVVSRDLPALHRLLAYAHAAGQTFLTLDLGHGPKRFRWTATVLGEDRLLTATMVVSETSYDIPTKLVKESPVRREERVLVIESDVARRMTLLRQLEKLGFQAFVATSATEAVEVTKRGFYDLILLNLDLHDGAGVAILGRLRAHERSLGHRQVIVGMTSCDSYASGLPDIDDWLCMPVEPRELQESLMKWLPDGPSVDLDALREATMGDQDLERHIVRVYLNSTGDQISNYERALLSGETDEARRITHSIKGGSLTTGVVRLGEMARDLEIWLRGGGFGDPPHSILELRNEFGRVSQMLKKRLLDLG